MSLALRNGVQIASDERAIASDDRGFNYGDGLFETTLVRNGSVRFLDAHLERLRSGCERLQMKFPGKELADDIGRLVSGCRDGVLKIVVTRSAGGRGYRPAPAAGSDRVLSLHALPPVDRPDGITIRWCNLQLSRNAALAGIKHLNRLEQVMAQNEWHDDHLAEGLMCDTEGELVSATAGNVFIVRNQMLYTPDLRFCGVRGVMRSQVLRIAPQLGLACSEEPLWPHDLIEAAEVFLTNAVRGIRPVAALEDRRWTSFPVAGQLIEALGL